MALIKFRLYFIMGGAYRCPSMHVSLYNNKCIQQENFCLSKIFLSVLKYKAFSYNIFPFTEKEKLQAIIPVLDEFPVVTIPNNER